LQGGSCHFKFGERGFSQMSSVLFPIFLVVSRSRNVCFTSILRSFLIPPLSAMRDVLARLRAGRSPDNGLVVPPRCSPFLFLLSPRRTGAFLTFPLILLIRARHWEVRPFPAEGFGLVLSPCSKTARAVRRIIAFFRFSPVIGSCYHQLPPVFFGPVEAVFPPTWS